MFAAHRGAFSVEGGKLLRVCLGVVLMCTWYGIIRLEVTFTRQSICSLLP